MRFTVLVLTSLLVFFVLSTNAQDTSKTYPFPKEIKGFSAKLGLNTAREFGFFDTRIAYKFGYTGKRYLEFGATIASAMGETNGLTRDFIDGIGNRVGLFGTFNYTPSYFYTKLSGKFILSTGIRHFYYTELDEAMHSTKIRALVINGKVGFGLEYKVLKHFEVSIANYLNGFLRKPLNQEYPNIRKTGNIYFQISGTYTF